MRKIAQLMLFAFALLWGPTANATPCLAIAVSAQPRDRPALLRAIRDVQAPLQKHWREQGDLSDSETWFTRASDAGVWDAMMLLKFRDDAAMTHWRAQISTGQDPIAPAVARLASSIQTTPCDSIRGGKRRIYKPVVLVIPYLSLVGSKEYQGYLDGYTIPQFEGWIAEGVLDSYEVLTSRFPADRAWNVTIVLRYRDDLGLARRDEVVGKVRERLSTDKGWKAYSDAKKSVRTEGRLALADIVPGG